MSASPQGRGLRPKQAANHIGISVASLWRYARNRDDFPRPVKLSEGVTIFFEGELNDWLAKQATRARAA
ncbi:helix-turn-helix transcriptional regulator [Paraburkholderia caribensis]|uniref:AlpA family phage regulatory protein n=1 Tax=Paraburkholderia caribensis TaxID=75105 RepID=A0A9Q6WLS0_9BURK|nr:AlpA family phage regulatory protein [Paraburkholderia caribensis]QLB63465.1 hypothetical protein A9O66_14385 [Paraburkholderia caribensis]